MVVVVVVVVAVQAYNKQSLEFNHSTQQNNNCFSCRKSAQCLSGDALAHVPASFGLPQPVGQEFLADTSHWVCEGWWSSLTTVAPWPMALRKRPERALWKYTLPPSSFMHQRLPSDVEELIVNLPLCLCPSGECKKRPCHLQLFSMTVWPPPPTTCQLPDATWSK